MIIKRAIGGEQWLHDKTKITKTNDTVRRTVAEHKLFFSTLVEFIVVLKLNKDKMTQILFLLFSAY